MTDAGQMSLFGMMGGVQDTPELPLPNVNEYDQQTKLLYEKEVTGLYLSGHPLQKYRETLSQFNFDSRILNSEELPENNTQVTMGGVIVHVKRLKTKSTGADMAVLTIEDLYGRCEVMLFPATYERAKNLLEPNAILQIKGKLSIRDGEGAIILADTISLLGNNEPELSDGRQLVTPAPVVNRTLYLKYNVADETLQEEVSKVLKAYKGEIPVIIRNTATGKALKSEISVRDCSAVVNELNSVIGSENVLMI